MLFTTLRHYLGPYRGSLLAVLGLKIVETIAVRGSLLTVLGLKSRHPRNRRPS